MSRLSRRVLILIRRSKPWPQLVAAVALLGAVGTTDWWTGPDVDFSLLYLLPVGLVAWNLGRPAGCVASVCSAAVWIVADRLTGKSTSDPLIAPWNMATRMLFFVGSVFLLTTWKHAESELARLVEERTAALRRLAAQLSEAEDAERRKLAYDMHDAISQTLSIIKMNLDSAQLATAADSPAGKPLATCGTLVEEVIKQSRTMMFDLHPAMLDDLGLVPTLQGFATEFSGRTGAEVIVSEQGHKHALPPAITNYLYRAVKELTGNAVRHGRAKSIVVTLRWEPAFVRVAVDDDGGGFDVAATLARGRSGLGLAGIDERLRSMGGSVTIESNLGHGTRVILELPVVLEELSYASAPAAG